MTTNKQKHIISNQIVRMRQLLFAYVNFLSLSEVSGLFNISSSHSNANLLTRYFSQEQFLVSKSSLILHALLHSQSHLLGFIYIGVYHINPNHLILYTHTDVHYDSISAMNYTFI